MDKGFVIQLPSGEYFGQPVTDVLIFAFFFKTEKMAQQALDRLRGNNNEYDKAIIRPVLVTLVDV